MAIKDLKCIEIPMRIDPSTGDVAMTTGGECIKAQILSVLQTKPGERVMRPQLGLREHALQALAPTVTTSDIEDQLQFWITSEAQCTVWYDKNPSKFEDGILDIEVAYSDGEQKKTFRLAISDV